MKKSLGFVGLCSVLLLSVGCVTLTPEGELVQPTKDTSKVEGCTLKGTITVKGLGEGGAVVESRNSAVNLGANVILVGDQSTSEDNRSVVESQAYLCE